MTPIKLFVYSATIATSAALADFTFNPISASNAFPTLTDALQRANSGITIVGGSESFNGVDNQSGTFSGTLTPNNPLLPTISQNPGIVLTSGSANIPNTNTDTSWEGQMPGNGGDADLSTLSGSSTNDANTIEFDFTVNDPSFDAISLNFIFASDEFPDQSVTDVFGIFVDGINYAFFPDNSLVSFVQGANAANFIDNNVGTNNYNFELDGLSVSLNMIGLLDTNLTTHTIKIGIADTSDSVFDSVALVSDLFAFESDENTGGGGIVDPTIPEPSEYIAMATVMATGFVLYRRNRKAKAAAQA